MKQKILIIAPHLSTGGMPQFLYKKLLTLVNDFEVHVIEWDNITGGVLVVHRDLIQNLLKTKLFTLGENKKEVFDIINIVEPDIIHFEEFPETFIDPVIAKEIYSNRNYFITETTHGTGFNPADKLFTADKISFVSKENYTKYKDLAPESEVIEFPYDCKHRDVLLKELGLDPSYYHVLNVGLFTSGKNQGEIFEYARKLSDKKIQFHFVGNQAGNFENYWRPIMADKPDNCVIWGERHDTHRFYDAMDLFLFTSLLENRPLSVLEALSYNMKVMLYRLPTYSNEFANNERVTFLTSSHEENVRLISELANIGNIETTPVVTIPQVQQSTSKKASRNISAIHILTDIDTNREIRSMQSLSKLKDFGIDYRPIVSKRYTDLPPAENCKYPENISFEPGGKLTPGHYGCYLGHKAAFEKGLEISNDYILIFECDAVLDIPHQEFMEKLEFACKLLDEKDLFWFSFGFHNNTDIIERNSDYWVVNRFYGAHAYLSPRKSYAEFKNMYETSKWNVADLLFVENLSHRKCGIFEVPVTKQAAGISILDKIENNDRY